MMIGRLFIKNIGQKRKILKYGIYVLVFLLLEYYLLFLSWAGYLIFLL